MTTNIIGDKAAEEKKIKDADLRYAEKRLFEAGKRNNLYAHLNNPNFISNNPDPVKRATETAINQASLADYLKVEAQDDPKLAEYLTGIGVDVNNPATLDSGKMGQLREYFAQERAAHLDEEALNNAVETRLQYGIYKEGTQGKQDALSNTGVAAQNIQLLNGNTVPGSNRIMNYAKVWAGDAATLKHIEGVEPIRMLGAVQKGINANNEACDDNVTAMLHILTEIENLNTTDARIVRMKGMIPDTRSKLNKILAAQEYNARRSAIQEYNRDPLVTDLHYRLNNLYLSPGDALNKGS